MAVIDVHWPTRKAMMLANTDEPLPYGELPSWSTTEQHQPHRHMMYCRLLSRAITPATPPYACSLKSVVRKMMGVQG